MQSQGPVHKSLHYEQDEGFVWEGGLELAEEVTVAPIPALEYHNVQQEQGPDLALYLDPPYRLAPKDYDKWFARMNQPDTDLHKED